MAISFARSSTGASGGVGSLSPPHMAEALLTQHIVRRLSGSHVLQRLIRANWLKPCRQEPHRVLFDPHDVHAAWRKLKRRACPPDRIEVARVRASELANGHPRVRKERPPRLGLREIELDFSTVDLGAYHHAVDGDEDDG